MYESEVQCAMYALISCKDIWWHHMLGWCSWVEGTSTGTTSFLVHPSDEVHDLQKPFGML